MLFGRVDMSIQLDVAYTSHQYLRFSADSYQAEPLCRPAKYLDEESVRYVKIRGLAK